MVRLIKRDFLKNALAVSAVSLSLNTAAIVFRTYVSNRVGSEVMGLLQLIMSVYFPACTLASSGVYVASTQLCSRALARRDRAIGPILSRCMVYGLGFGTAAFGVLFFGARLLAVHWLNYPEAETPLRILAFGLPFLSVSNALQGFFLSLRRASYSTALQIAEDLSKIAATVLLFSKFLAYGPHAALCAIVAGTAIGEIFSCLFGYALYCKKSRSLPMASTRSTHGLLRETVRIALPCATSGYLRSGIGMIESILVPRGLEAFGLTREQTLAALGKFEGMALPIIVFPAAFLSVISKLLVPEISAEHAVGNEKENKSTINSILTNTLRYAVAIGVFFFVFGEEIGYAVYRDASCGRYLRLLAPMVPILYCDRVTDGIMKGYNRQVTTMKINLAETVLQTVGAWRIIPMTGIGGYVGLFCVGAGLNFALSFRSMQKTCGVRFPLVKGVLEPLLSALAAVLPCRILSLKTGIGVWPCAVFAAVGYLLFSVTSPDLERRRRPRGRPLRTFREPRTPARRENRDRAYTDT